MKKYGMIGLTLLVLLGGVVAFALAQGDTAVAPAAPALDEAEDVPPVGQDTEPALPTGSNFVDDDGDGICDTCGQETHLAPADGSGSRYGADGGRGLGQGTPHAANNFIDEDGDGICDTCGTASGTGSNFVDEDGDGVCDTCGAGGQQGQGNRYGQTGERGQGQGQGAGQGHGGQGNGRGLGGGNGVSQP